MSQPTYATNHTNRSNLLIHILAVPLFWLATVAFLTALVTGDGFLPGLALLSLAVSMALQGFGHKLEHIPPEPFSGPVDFARRILVEQFYRFPVFVLSGEWRRSLRVAMDQNQV